MILGQLELYLQRKNYISGKKACTAFAMKTSIDSREKALAAELLKGTGLGVCDSGRLVLEALEELGELAQGRSRSELLALLRRVLRSGVEAVRAAERTVSLAEAAWASVEARADLRPTSRRDLRHFVRRILRVEGAAGLPLRGMSSAQCRRILEAAFGACRSSFVKGRAILHSVFAYGMRREWCDANPVSRIEVPVVRERPIVPLRPEEVGRLLSVCRQGRFRSMRFSLHLMLFCGVRPAEVRRLRGDDVFWEEAQVLIRPQVSKTGGGRAVPLRGMGLLRREECSIPRNWLRRWRELRRAAGFSRWVPDVCRHTFASYHAAFFRDLPGLQLEMGHRDCSLLRSRYVSPALCGEAVRFWEGVAI